MTDKRISITSFVKKAKDRAKIARLFTGADRILLTVNKVVRYVLTEYEETAKLTTPESDKPARSIKEGFAELAKVAGKYYENEPKPPSYAGVKATRYFLTGRSTKILNTATEKNLPEAAAIILVVPSYQVDADPERFKDLTEIVIQ